MRTWAERITMVSALVILAVALACLMTGCAGSPEEQASWSARVAKFDSTAVANYRTYEVTNVNGTTYRVRGQSLYSHGSQWDVLDHHAYSVATGGAGTTVREVQN